MPPNTQNLILDTPSWYDRVYLHSVSNKKRVEQRAAYWWKLALVENKYAFSFGW